MKVCYRLSLSKALSAFQTVNADYEYNCFQVKTKDVIRINLYISETDNVISLTTYTTRYVRYQAIKNIVCLSRDI